MFNYILISDESYASDYLLPLLSSSDIGLNYVGGIHCKKHAVTRITNLKPDIIFIDADTTSVDTFAILDSISCTDYSVILVSETETYAYTAFLYGVYDYILKSQLSELFRKSILRLINNKYSERVSQKNKIQRISISTSEGLIFIDMDTIIRIEADRSYSYLYLMAGIKKTVCKSLKEIEKLLPASQFYRTHNSHLVHLKHVEMIGYQDGGYVLMKDGSHIPIARRRKSDLVSYMTA